MLLATAESDAGVDTYLRATRQHSLDGVILMGVDERHPAITALVEAGGRRASRSTCRCTGPRTTYVSSDNRTGAGDRGGPPARARPPPDRDHHRPAQPDAGLRAPGRLPLPERPCSACRTGRTTSRHGDFFLASGYDATRRLLELPEPPDAIFAAGDEMAIGAMHAIIDAGLSVPGDIAVVGFDDIETGVAGPAGADDGRAGRRATSARAPSTR